MKLNELFSGFGLQKRAPRRQVEARQSLLNKLKDTQEQRAVTNPEKNSLEKLAERIKGANKTKTDKFKKLEKKLLRKLTTEHRR